VTLTLPVHLLRRPRTISMVCTALLHYGMLMLVLYLAHTPDQAWQNLAAQRTVLEVSLFKPTTHTDHTQSVIETPAPQPVKQVTRQPVAQPPAPHKTLVSNAPSTNALTPKTESIIAAASTPAKDATTIDVATSQETHTPSAPAQAATSAASSNEPVGIVSRKAQPDYAYNPAPDYPMLLRENNISGVVHMQVLVHTDGSPREINIHKSSGYRLMDEAALRAVRRWRFIPAMENGRISAGWVEFPIRFSLTNS
jgi:protein TonB